MGNDDKVKMQHILSRLTPNIPSTAFTHPLFGNTDNWYPFSQSFGSSKISKAFRQAETGAASRFATDFTPFEAIISTFGFKLQPVEFAKLVGIKNAEFSRGYASAKKKIYQLGKQVREGSISVDEAQEQAEVVYQRLDSLTTKYKAVQDKLERAGKSLGGYIRQGYSTGGAVGIPLEQELQALQLQSESGQALTMDNEDLYTETLNDTQNKRKQVNVGGAIKKVIKLYHGSGSSFDKFDKNKSIMGLMGKGLYFTPDKKVALRYTDTSEKNLKKMYGKKYIDEVVEAKKDSIDKILYEVEASLSDNEVLLVNTFKKQDKQIQNKLKSLVDDYNLNVDYNSKGLVSQVLKQLGDEGADVLPMYGIKAIKKDFTSSPLKGKTLGGDVEYSILDDSVLDIKNRTPFYEGNLVSQNSDPADTKIEGTNITFNQQAGKVEQVTPESTPNLPEEGQEFRQTQQQKKQPEVKEDPRNFRNKNPMNVITTDIEWNGKIPTENNTDKNKTFEQFETMYDGLRAGILNAHKKFIDGRANTISQMIEILSPKKGDLEEFKNQEEENPNNDEFKNFVAKRLDVGINDELNFSNKEVMFKFAKAISKFEGLKEELPDDLVAQALDSAWEYRNLK